MLSSKLHDHFKILSHECIENIIVKTSHLKWSSCLAIKEYSFHHTKADQSLDKIVTEFQPKALPGKHC